MTSSVHAVTLRFDSQAIASIRAVISKTKNKWGYEPEAMTAGGFAYVTMFGDADAKAMKELVEKEVRHPCDTGKVERA